MKTKGGRTPQTATGRQAKRSRILILLAVLVTAGLVTSQALAAQVSLPAGGRRLAVPVVVDDSYSVEMNAVLNVAAPGVLGNDSDPDLHAFTAQSGATNAANGALTLNADGSFDYTPDTGFWGIDTFTYTATDGTDTSVEATATITVFTVPEITGDNGVAVDEDADVTITLNDLIVTDPDNTYPDDFTLTVQTGTNYTVAGDTVSPILDYHGSLTVPVLVNDGAHDSNTYDLTVTVNPLNDAPAGANNTVQTAEDTARAFTTDDFGFNDPQDTIASNSLLEVVITTLPGAGLLKLNNVNVNATDAISAGDINAGNFTFVPANNGNGTPYTSFTFQVRDDGATGAGHQTRISPPIP